MDKLYGRSFMDFIKEAYKVKAATVIKILKRDKWKATIAKPLKKRLIK